MTADFDNYAKRYSTLLSDPLRDGFAASSFFHERKLLLIREFYRRQGWDTRESVWVDIGCGQGDLLKLGEPDFKLAAGCDVSPAMLACCEGLQVRRQERDDVLPFPDGFAGLATAVCVYHHVPPAKRAGFSREVARVLKPGGVFCIIEHNPLNPVTRAIVRRSPIDAGVRLLPVSESVRLAEDQGLRIESIQYFMFFPERIFRKIGSVEGWLGRFPFGGQYAVFARAV